MEPNTVPEGERQFCTFHLDRHYFAVAVSDVQEVFQLQEITAVPQASAAIRGLINLRGQIITAIDLRRRLGISDPEEEIRPTCIVIRTDEESVCLLVDRIGDVLSPPSESFEESPENLEGTIREVTQGVCKLEDDLLLILKTDVVVEKAAV